ncbi:MAG: hypothetical protein V9G12_24750 [Microthrixaceae bacterium]
MQIAIEQGGGSPRDRLGGHRAEACDVGPDRVEVAVVLDAVAAGSESSVSVIRTGL